MFEIIVVVNGFSDVIKVIVEDVGCCVIYYEEVFGINIGRVIGVKKVKGDILFFLDGDIVVFYEELMKYMKVIEIGYDIVLNDFMWIMKWKVCFYFVFIVKYMLNLCL